jgi:exodeoxyribonuclease V beta subunit
VTAFDLSAPLSRGRMVIEASAGTGKTYALTNLAVRHLVETDLVPEQLLMVTYTRAAANELRDRARAALTRAADVLMSRTAPAEHPWMEVLLRGDEFDVARRAARARDALGRFDDATITTIHGFCQQALGHAGLRSGSDPDAVLVENADDLVVEACRDVLIDLLVDDPDALPTGPRAGDRKTPGQVEKALVATVKTVLSNPEAMLEPARGVDPGGDLWRDAVERALDEVRARQRQRREIGFDRLVTDLRDALVSDTSGPAIAAQLSARFNVVLVDEFQDTDRVQWTVFERGFSGGTLVTVGDPKQAIYRFRGADVHAYLAAVETVTPQSLDVNHRSDARLLDGLGRLFDGAELGDPRITFSPVGAAPNSPLDAIGAGAAVQLRLVVPHEDLKNAAKENNLAMPLVVRSCSGHGRSRRRPARQRQDQSGRPVRDGRVARRHRGARALARGSSQRRGGTPARPCAGRAHPHRFRPRDCCGAPVARPARGARASAPRTHGARRGARLVPRRRGRLARRRRQRRRARRAAGAVRHHGERMRCVGVAAAYDELKSGTRMLPSLLVRPDGRS